MNQAGDYVIGDPIWDHDFDTWTVRIGMKAKNGYILHYSAHSRISAESAIDKAVKFARIMTVVRPDDLKIVKGTDKLIDDALNAQE